MENDVIVTVNAKRYCEMLHERAIPQLKSKRFFRTIFQQVRPILHTATVEKEFLLKNFADRIITFVGLPDLRISKVVITGCGVI